MRKHLAILGLILPSFALAQSQMSILLDVQKRLKDLQCQVTILSGGTCNTTPTIASLSPTSGAVGTTVTVTGTALAAPLACNFGTTAATLTAISNTQMSCIVPSLAAGAYSVTVRTANGTSNGQTFTVVAGEAYQSLVVASNLTVQATNTLDLTNAATITCTPTANCVSGGLPITPVGWSVVTPNCGTITGQTYTAPATTGACTIKGCAPGSTTVCGTNTVSVTPAAGHNVATVSLGSVATQAAGATIQIPYTLTPSNTVATDVTWATGPDCGGTGSSSITVVNDPTVDKCGGVGASCGPVTPGAATQNNDIVIVTQSDAYIGLDNAPMAVPTATGLTFTARATRATSNGRASVATAVATGASGAITCHFDTAGGCAITIVRGGNTSALTNTAVADDANVGVASFGATLSAASSGSLILGAANNWNINTVTPNGSTTTFVLTSTAGDGVYWSGRLTSLTSSTGTTSSLGGTWGNAPIGGWNEAIIEIQPGTVATACTYAGTSGNQVVGGNTTYGSISTAGVYTAPSPSTTTSYTITAQSKDPSCTNYTNGVCWAYVKVQVTGTGGGGTGADWYFSPGGAGTTCSSGSPCTFATALGKLSGQSGKIIQGAAGDYGSITLTSAHSGTVGSPNVIRADPAAATDTVRILGGTKLSTWARCQSSGACSGIWASLPTVAKSGCSGGTSCVWTADLSGLGSWPNQLSGATRSSCATDAATLGGTDGCPSSATMLLHSKPPTGYCTAGLRNNRRCPLPTIMARDPNRDSLGRNQWTNNFGATYTGAFVNRIFSAYWSTVEPWASYGNITDGGFVFNHPAVLDQAGEYYLDYSGHRVYFFPWTDADPSTGGAEVIVSTTGGPVVTFDSTAANIVLQGFTIEGGQTDCVSIAGANIKLGGTQALPGYIRHCANFGVNIAHTAGGDGHVIDHQIISNIGNDAIVNVATSTVVSNNEISEWGLQRSTYTVAHRTGGNNQTMEHNKIFDGPGFVTQVVARNFLFQYNDVSRVSLDGSDNGNIHNWGSSPVTISSTFRYNYFHDLPYPSNLSQADWTSYCAVMYDDDNISGSSWYGNVLYNIGHNDGGTYGQNVESRLGSISKGSNTHLNNLIVKADVYLGTDGSSFAMDNAASQAGATHNLFAIAGSPQNSTTAGYGTYLANTSTLNFANEQAGAAWPGVGRDLSNGSGRFSYPSVFITDPNGLNYIPWSSIGIQP